jgi:hypothetical protein
VDDGIWRWFWVALFIAFEVIMCCQGIEDLARLREVGLEREDTCLGVWEVDKIKVEDLCDIVSYDPHATFKAIIILCNLSSATQE